jgi:hypothetical protein
MGSSLYDGDDGDTVPWYCDDVEPDRELLMNPATSQIPIISGASHQWEVLQKRPDDGDTVGVGGSLSRGS